MKERTFTGTRSNEEQAYEIEHRELARVAATEGFVLLKNEGGLLPLKSNHKVALYGSGAIKTIKGGTGSGDVNERATVTIFDGLKNAGFTVTTTDWMASYEKQYQKAREDWRDEIWSKCSGDSSDVVKFFDYYSTTKFNIPAGDMPEKTDTDTAIFVLARVAGEGADRFSEKGDYYLTEEEDAMLKRITELYSKVIVLLNTGGIVDCSFLEQYKIDSLLLISQPGMEAGNAVADVLTGKVTPSGKLTDSWAYKYEDYPNYENFSHNNGDVNNEYYHEGIYVGYRYFDTWEIPVRYDFGYGLSYTAFDCKIKSIQRAGTQGKNPVFSVIVDVKNTGSEYAGREVVQVYVSCPQTEQEKEFRRLVGFAKTGLLAPGQSEELEITWSVDQMTSYDETKAAWVLERGCYGIYVGNSLNASELEGAIELADSCVRVKTDHICPLKDELEEFSNKRAQVLARRAEMEQQVMSLPRLTLAVKDIETDVIDYHKGDFLAESEDMDFVNTLTTEQLIQLATGDPGKGQGSNLGSAGITVPGSAAETSSCAKEQELGSIVLADGPAGLRLNKKYQVVDGRIISMPFEKSIENGFLYRGEDKEEGDTYYQYCTAVPIGTLLAQTWDKALVREVGHAIGEEMNLFNVTLWLAPGMCIHRNPLCGRNFEYYSEDPFVSGMMASAMTDGVQSVHGCGTTIKHFCCNSQEDNRMGSNSILSERALREIYMKGFEIAVKESKPLSIMTSYNLINGIHAANCYDICTKAARDEWGFDGVFMTDWTTTHNGPDCTASGCMRAGNDLVMPGIPADHENMKKELEAGTLKIDDLKRSITHMVHVVRKTS